SNPDRLVLEIRGPGSKAYLAKSRKLPELSTTARSKPPAPKPKPKPPAPTAEQTAAPPKVAQAKTKQPEPAETPKLQEKPQAPPATSTPKKVETASAKPPPKAPPTTEPTEPEPKTDDGPVATPAKRNRSGGRSLTRVLGLKLGRVVIDPGHGGRDTGTIGPTGLREKDISLDVAKRLAKLIDERMGSEVILTRSSDATMRLEARTQKANEVKADLFLSIHVNASRYRSVSGVETFYLNFTRSRADLEVAARENAGSSKSIHELSDLVSKIALDDKVQESRDFAGSVQNAVHRLAKKKNAKARNRGVKKAPFVVLIGAQMPSALVELGFISNPKDEKLMKNKKHRQAIAEALYEGVAAYASTLSHFQVARTNGLDE
ncbi:MAG: N-acetylmuramoyl-L-alanine amidase, partial [bacterium]|nr:N-acetylmuramoyl-L-alanine amidase [bacterium]